MTIAATITYPARATQTAILLPNSSCEDWSITKSNDTQIVFYQDESTSNAIASRLPELSGEATFALKAFAFFVCSVFVTLAALNLLWLLH